MKPVNYASYLPSPGASLEVATAPLPDLSTLADDEIIIKNKAVAIKYSPFFLRSFGLFGVMDMWNTFHCRFTSYNFFHLGITLANSSYSPVDWKIRDSPPGNNRFGIKYPFILGEDVAGEVLQIGSGVKHLQKGDRVFAHALGLGAGDTACM